MSGSPPEISDGPISLERARRLLGLEEPDGLLRVQDEGEEPVEEPSIYSDKDLPYPRVRSGNDILDGQTGNDVAERAAAEQLVADLRPGPVRDGAVAMHVRRTPSLATRRLHYHSRLRDDVTVLHFR